MVTLLNGQSFSKNVIPSVNEESSPPRPAGAEMPSRTFRTAARVQFTRSLRALLDLALR